MREIICIVCPKGCRLKVDEEKDCAVSGQGCSRGEEYGRAEVLHPMRVLTSTVRVEGGLYPRCPVKSRGSIPKELMFPAMALLDTICLTAPVEAGTVIIPDILGSGVPLVTSRSL